MALNSSALVSDIAAIFEAMPADKEEAALKIATAYKTYAVGGMFGASVPTITNAMRDTMKATLATGLTVPGLPPTVAAAFAASVAAFWIAVPVVGAQSGATTSCPGAAALVGSLTAVFANLANTAQSCGAAVGAALHTATLTVTATVSPPGGTVLPIA